MDPLVARVVTPAIYKFEFSEPVQLRENKNDKPTLRNPSSWGWHKASELLEAINNLLASKGRQEMSAREVERNFAHLSPLQDGQWFLIVGRPSGTEKVDPFIHNDEWLESAIRYNGYLPAEIGMRVLRAIKHPKFDEASQILNDLF